MPPKSKRTDAIAALPMAKKAAARLHEDGEVEMAEAVHELVRFASPAGQRREATALRGAGLAPNRPLQVHRDFRTHVNARKTTGLPDVVVPYLERFLAGEWMPGRHKRVRWGSPADKVNINIRIPSDLWDAVDALAKDPAASQDRGYKLTAMQVAIAALHEEFAEPAADATTA